MKSIIRWGSYPIIFGVTALLQFSLTSSGLGHWPLSILIAASGIATVAFLERIQPYEAIWNRDHNDTLPDLLHAAFSLSFIFASVEVAEFTRNLMPSVNMWPANTALWLQVLIAGAIIDFGLWFMHWLSHKSNFLWRLHALHHSSERLYWLNGERRHPVSALLLAAPGVIVVIAIGVPATVVGCWFSIIAVHLAFQHSNLDYSVGIFRNLLGVAEIHRWHHKREYEDAQVNFGEFWMIWDQIFGTFKYRINGVRAGEVGMMDPMPTTYWKQILWPFKIRND